jgi:hypothetical protein
MGTKSRETMQHYPMSAERATEARRKADRLACAAWNYRILGYVGPAKSTHWRRWLKPESRCPVPVTSFSE